MAAGSNSSRSVPLNRTRSNPERIPVIFCPNLLRKLSGTPWVAGNSLVFTHRFYQGPRCSTMIWLRLCRAVIFPYYANLASSEHRTAVTQLWRRHGDWKEFGWPRRLLDRVVPVRQSIRKEIPSASYPACRGHRSVHPLG